MNGAKYPLILVALAGLMQGGCMFRQAGIDRMMNQQLADDRTEVNTTQQAYHASVLEFGLQSGKTQTASDSVDNAQRQLEIDKRQFDNYLSASGQSSEPRE